VRGSGTGSSPIRSGLLLLLLAGTLPAGCGTVGTALAPQPVALDFGDQQIHAPAGDLTATVPLGWVMIDPPQLASLQAFGAFCNPEYTVAVAFARAASGGEVSTTGTLQEAIDVGFALRKRRSGDRAQLLNRGETTVSGRTLGVYTYTTDSSQTVTRVVVIPARMSLYECSITPLSISGRSSPIPLDSMGRLHQAILGAVEW